MESTSKVTSVSLSFAKCAGSFALRSLSAENFCRWFTAHTADSFFVSSVFFINEVRFISDGMINLHKQHLCVERNLHGTIQALLQRQIMVYVRNVIVDHCLIGSYIPAGAVYRNVISNKLPDLLDDVSLLRCM